MITACLIFGNAEHGIFIQGGFGHIIFGCKIRSNDVNDTATYDGVRCYNNDNTIITNNIIEDNDRYEVVISYPERDILESGWLIGEEKLKRKTAMVVARYGEGQIVLIGFRTQLRAQTHGTYKLLFNSLLS